ncbi:hypothetical protein HG531_012153 [Fusarium graminearum]|nr:hypothetical protein HG531_012153 [Fusarium graminearum]
MASTDCTTGYLGILLEGKLVTRDTKLDQLASLLDGIPARASNRVLDPSDEPLVDGVGKLLLGSGDALSSVGGSDDVIVGTKEAVNPGLLLLAAEIKEIIDRAVETGVTVLDTAAKRLAGKISRVVSRNEVSVGNVSAVSIKGVDPRAKVTVLSTVDKAEDGSLAVGSTSQQRDLRSVAAGSKTGGVVGESSNVVNNGGEPGVEGGVEVLGLEVKQVDVAETLELSVSGLGAANFLGDSIESLIDRGISGA